MTTEDRQVPWGRIAGLAMACVVTMIGVGCRLEPFVILQRAVIAAVLVGWTVRITILLVGVVVTSEKKR